ncbi:MAG: AAA family ATPase [bacterium]|nr:AAA family ATPase [bacterium]
MRISIESNIIRYMLKDVYFINGTAYAGKSTMVKRLAKKHNGICCGENYHLVLSDAINEVEQPNMWYMKTLKDWHDFVNRTPEEYDRWITDSAKEITGLEIALLLQYAKEGKKVFVDTNIAPAILKEISEYNHVLIMLSPQETSINRFFEREDKDKQFLYQLLIDNENPEKALENYRQCLKRVNSKEHYKEFEDSGFKVLKRDESRTIEETLDLVEEHFQLK